MSTEELTYRIALEQIPKVGSLSAKRLIAHFGSAEAIFRERKQALERIPGIGPIMAHEIANQQVLTDAQAEVEFIARHGIRALLYLDPEYPERLRQCDDGPLMLYVKGSPAILNTNKVVSIVGTRKATSYGIELCKQLVEGMAALGHTPVVVSGLAYGIDIAAHRAALHCGLPTVAVLAHGLNTIYPSAHRGTAQEIAATGALVTDFTSNAHFDRKHFLKRNRIIAGLADATVVVESAAKGGALVTAEIANSYNREVFAVPGNVGAPYSKGCLDLIKTQRAGLIEDAADLERGMNWDVGPQRQPVQAELSFEGLSENERKIVEHLRNRGEDTIDLIAIHTGLPVASVLPSLLNLEFAGLVVGRPGKVFKLN